jgi:MFS family permease
MVGVGGATFLAGLLFGYDQGVVSGALLLLQVDLDLSTLESGIITSWVTLGGLFGALVAGGTADRSGRRWTAVARDHRRHLLRLSRGRRAHGLGSLAPHVRARGDPRRRADRRLPRDARVGALAPQDGPPDDARASLVKVDGPELADSELATIEGDLEREKGEGQASWGEVFSPTLRRALWVGVGLAVFQQVTGINAIIYYANEIFAEARFTTAEAQAKASLYAVGAVNVLATLIAVAWVDRFGRRPLLFSGLVGMAVSLAAVGASFAALENQPAGATSTTVGGIVTVLALVVFIASFAFSMGPIAWTLIAEIYPNRVRGRAISVATAVNWLSAFLVAQFFLSIVDAIGESTTFFIFSALCVATYVFVWALVPETKGRSLEEIQERWVLNGDRMLDEEQAA